MTDFRAFLDAATADMPRALTDGLNAQLARQFQTGDGPADGWIVVPESSNVWWIAAKDSEGERRGREAAKAFFAPDVAKVDNATAFHVFEPLGSLLEAGGYQRYARIQTTQPRVLAEYLELLVTVRLGQPPPSRSSEASVPFLIRDFYLALEAQDFVGAPFLLDRIGETGVLRGENLRFLEVEFLARAGRWSEIRTLRWFDELGDSQRPAAISTHLLETLWRTESFADQLGGPGEESLSHRFLASGLPERHSNLFRTAGIPRSLASRRILALWLSVDRDAKRIERLLEVADEHEREVLRRLAGQVAAAPTESGLRWEPEGLQELLDDARYDELVGLAEAHSDNDRALAIAVRAAASAQDPDLCQRVCALVDANPNRELFTRPGLQRSLMEVRSRRDQVCDSWTEWIGRISSDTPWSVGAEVARSNSAEWPLDPLMTDAGGGLLTDQLLSAVVGSNASEMRGALATLCSLAGRVAQSGGSSDFVAAVLLILADEPGASPVLLDSVSNLVSSIVNSGPGASLYDSTIEAVETCWKRCESANYFDWYLDLIDSLAAAPIPPGLEPRRNELLAVAARFTFQLGHRLLPDQELLVLRLAKEQDVTLPVAAAVSEVSEGEGPVPWSDLGGKSVLLYSLLNGVGERFRRRLLDLCPGVLVSHRDDTHCSDQLKQAVLGADVVVVDVHHASHSGTGCIDAVLPTRDQIRPNGRGVSAFIRELGETLRTSMPN